MKVANRTQAVVEANRQHLFEAKENNEMSI
jgi:hypothetical protein